MTYDNYIQYIRRLSPGYASLPNKNITEMLKDEYIRKALAVQLLQNNIIDSGVYTILTTKNLLNYL